MSKRSSSLPARRAKSRLYATAPGQRQRRSYSAQQSNAYLWQRVTLTPSTFTPGFPRILDGQGEGRAMTSHGSSTVELRNGGNSWVIVATEFSTEYAAVRRYMASSSKVLSTVSEPLRASTSADRGSRKFAAGRRATW